MHQTSDKNPPREETWQCDAAKIRRGAERLALTPSGQATHASPAYDFYCKAPGANGGKLPGGAERREAIGGGGSAGKRVPSPATQETTPPPFINSTILEEARISIDIETSPTPTKYCQHLATHRNPHHTHILLKSPLLTGTQPPDIIP